MTKFKTHFVILVLFLSVFCAYAAKTETQDAKTQLIGKVEKVITDSMMKNNFLPGLAVGIVFSDGSKYIKGFGKANIEVDTPVKHDSVFEIGSLSKTFTAVGILLLKQEGKIDLNDKITKYFPQFPEWSSITVKNLLQHSSGISDICEIEPFKSNQGKYWAPHELVKIIGSVALEAEPGQKIKYSNSNYILLGLIIEKISGQTFKTFLEKRITGPLGMKNTSLGSNQAIIKNRVAGYTLNAEGLFNAEYACIASPYTSGGIISTVDDLTNLRKIFTPGVLLSKENIDEMCMPAVLNNGQEGIISNVNEEYTFGYGLDLFKRNGVFVPGKTGAISGFCSYFAYFKDIDTFIVVLSNMDNSFDVVFETPKNISDIIKESNNKNGKIHSESGGVD